jgi:hypothetical protein
VTKRLTISLLLCLLALAIVSNRLFLLRQVAIAAHPSTNVHQPFDDLVQSGFTGKFLVPEAQQDEFELQKLAPPLLQTAVDLYGATGCLPQLKSGTFAQAPPYILLSVLNL